MPKNNRGQLTTTGLFGGPAFANERDFTTAVVNVAKHAGWLVHHSRTAITQSGRWATPIQGTKGFPDLVMVKGERMLVRELKMPRGVVSAEQRQWLASLQEAGIDAGIWYPRDYDETIIPTLMQGIRR